MSTPLRTTAGRSMAGGVTVHTIFWAPSGFAIPGVARRVAAPTYEGTIEKFYTDVSATSTGTSGRQRAISGDRSERLQQLHGRDRSTGRGQRRPTVRRQLHHQLQTAANRRRIGGGPDSSHTTDDCDRRHRPPIRRPTGTNAVRLRCVLASGRQGVHPGQPRCRTRWTRSSSPPPAQAARPADNLWYVFLPPERRRVHQPRTCAGPTISAATTSFRTSATA